MNPAKTISALTGILISLSAAAASPNGAITVDISADSGITFSYNYSQSGIQHIADSPESLPDTISLRPRGGMVIVVRP